MFAAKNTQLSLVKPNVIYFKEKQSTHNPKHKIIKKISTKKKTDKKRTRKCKTTLSQVYRHDVYKVKNENMDYNDPLLTSQLEIKCENYNDTESFINSDNENDKDFRIEDFNDDVSDNSEVDEELEKYPFRGKLASECNMKSGKAARYIDYDKNENENETVSKDDENIESIALLTRIRKRNKRTLRLSNCPETCKHKCTTKFDKTHRIDIYSYYWQLSEENKQNFLRKHIRKRVMLRIYSKNSRNNYCYFLKNYKIGVTSDSEVSNLNADSDLIKVCRCFFKSTLCVLDSEMKESIDGYEVLKERVILPPKDEINKDIKKLPIKVTNKTYKYLDPETGTLTATNTKRKRRRPSDPLPEHFPKPIQCNIRCKFKCHLNFTEEERKKICDIFWSLDFKRRKDFILSRIETTDVKSHLSPEFRKTDGPPRRTYQTKYYLRTSLNSENKRVCKNFLMNTLCTNHVFIENAIQYADKTTGSYVGEDRRGVNSHNKISEERRQIVKDHINSYPFWLPNKKSKTKYLHHSLTIKQMYMSYRVIVKEDFVSPKYYSRVLHEDFHIAFLTNPNSKGGGFLLFNPNLSHYTGEELGGFWVDSKGNILDIRTINPAQCLNIY